ncbi:MAG: cobyrinate a,c-diamide synthase [Desulfobacterales bacterium]
MDGRESRSIAIKGIVIGAAGSGSGKTTITLGLMAAARAHGLSVAAFKVGPDFIDPGHHTRLLGRPSRNLDGWMLSRERNLEIFSRGTRDADLAVVEGVMGLFDGYDGRSEAGSTAQMAKWLGLPVLLVVNAASMARSAAALVQGFERFDSDLSFAGALFNRIGSPRHLAYLSEAMEGNVRMPVLGGIPRTDAVQIPERHLGLLTSDDHPLSAESISGLRDLIDRTVDVDALVRRLPEMKPAAMVFRRRPEPDGCRVRIGVARDRAFCFYYPDNLEYLEAAGAEIVPFSPLAEADLPGDVDGLYFGGGYPELSALALAANHRLAARIRTASMEGMPIYAECGGFMYLCRRLIDADGNTHSMAGCLPFTTRMLPRLKALGYREVTLDRNTVLGPAGRKIRGHEFHYSELTEPDDSVPTVYSARPREGVSELAKGYQLRRTLGSYVHLHFGSCPEAAEDFVESCRSFRAERKA